MTDPIFILGCHRSGTSVVAGLLHEACGVEMGELMPATVDNPLGYYEAKGVVDAHRDLLFQMERDWTCPPDTFRPGRFDLAALSEQIDIHRKLPGVWAVKDPRSMFLLRAWSHLGIERARLVAVVRAPADTVRSIERRDGIREDRAEAIVNAYLKRLAEIARLADLPVIRFSSDGAAVLQQVRELADWLQLDWNQQAAESFFDPTLVRHESPLRETNPAYDELLRHSFVPNGKPLPSVALDSLRVRSKPEWPLVTHLSVRHARQRHELWELAKFSSTPAPVVAELLLEGARLGGGHRPGVKDLHQIEVDSPVEVGAALMQRQLRPHGVIAHGLLTGRSRTEVEFFFRSLYVNTHVFAEVVVDVPEPRGAGLHNVEPPPPTSPGTIAVIETAEGCGWDHLRTERVSPGRVGVVFRKRVLTDHELVPVVTDLMASVDRIHAIDAEVQRLTKHLALGPKPEASGGASNDQIRALTRRAETAERDLRRLRNRRSVRLSLAMAKPFQRVFRMVRTWKNAR